MSAKIDSVLRRKLSILVRVARADGHLADSEVALIRRIGFRNGVDMEQVMDIIYTPEDIGSLGALSRNQKFEFLADVVTLIAADYRLHQSEKMFYLDIGIRLGFRKAVLEDLWIKLEKHTERLTDVDRIKKMVFSLPHD